MQGNSSMPAALPTAVHRAWTRVRRKVLPLRCSWRACPSPRLSHLWSSQSPLWFGGAWYCSASCAEDAVLRHLDRLASTSPPPVRHQHRVPLGLLLLSRGDLSEQQLHRALEAQREDQTRKIGEWLQELQFASEQQVLTGLGLQWALPLLSSPESTLPGTARLLPAALRRELRLVPVRLVEPAKELYVATSERVDYALLAAIESLLDCRVVPCLVSERVMCSWLGSARITDEDLAQHFERATGPSEMARITCSYAARLHCEDLRIARCGSYIWVRLGHRRDVAHLLFRLPYSAALPVSSPHLPAAV
jgi:hypothetical protein